MSVTFPSRSGDLGRSVGLLGELLEGLRDGVVVVDRDFRVKAFNTAFARLFRLEPGVIEVGDTLETLLRAVEARGGLQKDLSGERAIQRRLADWRSPINRRERRYTADGRVIDVLRSPTEDGDIVAVNVDVTDSVRRDRALELQRIYMESILDNITDGVTLVDADGHYIAFNRCFLQQFEIDPAKVRWGMHFEELYPHFGDLDGLPEAERRAAIEERRDFITDPARRYVRRVLHNGRVLDISKALLPAGGCVLTIRERTKEEERERDLERARAEAEETSRHKSQFLARMSHEMRTPLNGVLGVAELLRHTDLDTRQRELVEVISGSGDMLLRLIDDVLDLSRIEAGSIELRSAPFGLCDVMRECFGLIGPIAAEKGLSFEKDPSPLPVPRMIGDGVRVKQVVLNLLSNAVKFTPEGGVRAGVRFTVEGDLCRCRIFVTDTGIGVPHDQRDAIFGQFYQVDGSQTRGAGGAGLGLTITRRLVEAMGGAIGVAPAPGGGTTFTVRLSLPLADPAAAEAD